MLALGFDHILSCSFTSLSHMNWKGVRVVGEDKCVFTFFSLMRERCCAILWLVNNHHLNFSSSFLMRNLPSRHLPVSNLLFFHWVDPFSDVRSGRRDGVFPSFSFCDQHLSSGHLVNVLLPTRTRILISGPQNCTHHSFPIMIILKTL